MTEATPAAVPDARSVQQETAAAASRWNPWGVALLVIAGLLFAAAYIAWALGDVSAGATYDDSQGPTHVQLALYQHITGVTLAGLATLIVVLRIAVEAVRWDPAGR